jgi:hypothetical protein
MNGLDWQTLHLPFAAGLDQKTDSRAMQPPALARCVDAQFDEVGGLQTRYPYAELGSDIFGGGAISDARRIVQNGNELLLFTKDALYSWNAQLSKWVLKGTHLAVKVEEAARFVTTDDQVQCDRAELSGAIVYAWSTGSKGYVAALDKTTGNVLMAPTALAGGASRLRVLALTTKILLTFYDGVGGLYAYALDPAAPATALAGASTTLTNSNYGEYYDVTRVLGADQAVFACRRNPTTSYLVGTVTAGLTVATSTKARVCTAAIAVSSTPDGQSVQVIRTDGTNILGDLVTVATLADAYTAQAIGTAPSATINQIAAAHRSTTDSGANRCYVFWSSLEDTHASGWSTKYNWVDTGNGLGTQDDFRYHLAPGSRAFDRDGRVFVWMAFAGAPGFAGAVAFGAQLQNTYFLYRDDGEFFAKAAMHRGGGFSDVTSFLPGVQGIDGETYAWCGVERRVINLGTKHRGYADGGPRDVVFAFDSNEARRCVRLGLSLYITGGEILQYDGERLAEVGFHVTQWDFALTQAVGPTSHTDGDYAYKGGFRWDNGQGETERSAGVVVGIVTVSGGPKGVAVGSAAHLTPTHKPNASCEFWRTAVDPTADAPFYLITSRDPRDTGLSANEYIVNDSTSGNLATLGDSIPVADLLDLESHPENGSFLESLAPPAATIIAATDTRLFIAGVAGDKDRVWYSKQRSDSEVAAFNDALTINVPPGGGDITALAYLNETLIVFRETAVYAMPGDGFDNGGGGNNFGPGRALSLDVGAVNHEGVGLTDKGLLFKSSKGWYLLTKGWSLEYVGGAVSDYDSETPLAMQVVESQHQVRILTSARMLVLDTLVGQWGEWSINDGVHACMWNGSHVYLASAGAKQQQTLHTGLTYGMDIETGWIKLADLQGFGRIRWFEILGQYISAHHLRVRLARDYWKDGVDTYFQDKSWAPQPSVVLQLRQGPSIQQVQALKIRITAMGTDDLSAPDGAALKLTGLGLELGFKRGLNRQLPSAQKQ